MPIHLGFDGTLRPATLAGTASLARVYAGLLDRLDVWDVTLIGNLIGGWIAAELALLDSPWGHRGYGRPLDVPVLSDQVAAEAVTMGERLRRDDAERSMQIADLYTGERQQPEAAAAWQHELPLRRSFRQGKWFPVGGRLR